MCEQEPWEAALQQLRAEYAHLVPWWSPMELQDEVVWAYGRCEQALRQMRKERTMTKKKGFIAQVAEFSRDVEYTGAMSGSMFTPGEIVEQVLPGLRGGQLFAYLFRRFGYPSSGWDNRKELVNYYITTPMKDVFLNVRPSMGGDYPVGHESSHDRSRLMLGYCVSTAVEEEYYTLLRAGERDAWYEHPTYKACNQAFEVGMRDLLRPVYVRDVPINCYGRLPDEACEKLPAPADAYHAAGYPIPRAFLKSTSRYEAFIDALIKLGGESMEKGIERVIELASEATS